MVQMVKCLRSGMRTISRTHGKKTVMVLPACSPSTGKAETDGPLKILTSQPPLLGKLQARKRCCCKNKQPKNSLGTMLKV